MSKPLITDIQKYCLHDGLGIRTTVFFKGCPLSCSWCHNPETQKFQTQLLFQAESCTGCGNCLLSCPNKAITIEGSLTITDNECCEVCGSCTDYCLQNIREISGKYYTIEELIHEIDKDKMFYEKSFGGVTFSGGEVMTQDIDYLEKLLCRLWEKGIRINLDTSGYAPYEAFERVIPYVDTFLYDLKLMDPILHKKYTGADNTLIINNLKKLSQAKAGIWIRIPVIEGVNASVENIKQIAEFLTAEKIGLKQINLLPYHNTGSAKYKRMGKVYEGDNFEIPSKERLESLNQIFKEYGYFNVIIGG